MLTDQSNITLFPYSVSTAAGEMRGPSVIGRSTTSKVGLCRRMDYMPRAYLNLYVDRCKSEGLKHSQFQELAGLRGKAFST